MSWTRRKLVPLQMDRSTFPAALRNRRILLCTESFGPVNGVSRTTLMLVNHLRQHGVNVAVVAPYNHTNLDTFVPRSGVVGASQPGPSAGRNVEVRVHGYPLPYNPELSVAYPVRVSALCDRTFGTAEPPDLIYLASPASLGFQVMLQMRQRPSYAQVPIIANYQTDLGGYCAILLPGFVGALAQLVFAKVEWFFYRHPSVKTVFYPSSAVRRYLSRGSISPGKMHLLQRGVDTALFHPSKHSQALREQLAPNGELILLCVSRIAGEKGFEFLAAAATELDIRGVPFTLHIVGGNRNEDIFHSVRALFAPLIVKGRVVFAGFRVGEDLARCYATADVFLHCSVTETFGLVVLESMASGVPVVARDEGGPADIVDHGISGFLTPAGGLEAFVDKVVLLTGNAELRSRFAGAARRQACEATWDKINNEVAWRMVTAIEDKRREISAAGNSKRLGDRGGTGDFSEVWWEYLVERAVDTRLVGGLFVITAVWGVVGLYLALITAILWTKARTRL